MTGYTEFRQRLYRPRLPLLWWLRRRSYLVFVVRELTSVFVAWSVAFTLIAVHAILQGAEAYRRFLDWSAAPWLIVVSHGISGFTRRAGRTASRPHAELPPTAEPTLHREASASACRLTAAQRGWTIRMWTATSR